MQPSPSKVRNYYQLIVRIIESYIFLCFILITVIPLFEYTWVPIFIRVVYLTGFPLLLLVLLISFIKEPLLNYFEKKFESNADSEPLPVSRKKN